MCREPSEVKKEGASADSLLPGLALALPSVASRTEPRPAESFVRAVELTLAGCTIGPCLSLPGLVQRLVQAASGVGSSGPLCWDANWSLSSRGPTSMARCALRLLWPIQASHGPSCQQVGKATRRVGGVRLLSTARDDAETNAANLLTKKGHKGVLYTHLISLPIGWGHLDSLGHVNNVRLFNYFEEARCRAFDDAGLVLNTSAAEGPILAETACRYRAPLTYPDTVTVGAVSEQHTSNSWTQSYAVVSWKSGNVVAEGKANLVWIDYRTGARKDIPLDVANNLFDGQLER